mmetsp:Transcript_17329/g.37822  ORF Transcript_17329/g.37822 Transcript_17329/m.37822 type:complete len:604 (-) Transcript_17329:147-1958(-)
MTTSRITPEPLLHPRIVTGLPPSKEETIKAHHLNNASDRTSPVSTTTLSSDEEEEEERSCRMLSRLERKRLSLCQQRVQLERRLFEASHQTVIVQDDTSIASGNHHPHLWSDMGASVRHLDTNSSVVHQQPDDAESSIGSEDDMNQNPRNVTNHLVRFDGRRGHAHWTGPLTWPAPDATTTTTPTTTTSSTGTTTSRVYQLLQPNGRGTMRYSNGQVYEGHVMNGLRHGFGKNRWPDGQEYTGHWQLNSRAGRGSHMWPDGKTVTGQWTTGHLNGRCFFQWPDGATYDGDTLNGKKHGRGVHTWVDGKIYKGQYEGGFEHGFGTLTEADGLCRYRGNFRYGQRHGYGTQIWKEKTYEGEWQYNAVAGKGKLSWKNGAVYKGEFAQGRYHGHGMFVDKSGRKYVGHWVQGQKEGANGRETWSSETGVVTTYEGSFVKGRRHGFGRLTKSDGSLVYAGEFVKNKRSGRGIALHPNHGGTSSVLHCGVWKNDQPVSSYSGQEEDCKEETKEDYVAIWEELRQQALSNAWEFPAIAPFDGVEMDKSRIASTGSLQSGSSMDDLDLYWYLSSPQPSMKQQQVQDAEFFHGTTSAISGRTRRKSLAWDE